MNLPETEPRSSSPAEGLDSAYAWRRLAVSLALSTIGGIGLWSVVVSLPAIEAEFGVDRGSASLPYLATMIGFACGGVMMGRLSDRFSIRVPLIIGAIMLGIGYFGAAQVTALWQFIAVQTIAIGFLGSSVSFGPLVADVSLWFRRRRGIAVAIVASGNYLSGTIWPPILQHAIETIGWRQAHMGIGLVCVVTMIPLAMLLRRPSPTDDGVAADGTAEVLATSPCWCWCWRGWRVVSPCRCRKSISSPIVVIWVMARSAAPRCCH